MAAVATVNWPSADNVEIDWAKTGELDGIADKCVLKDKDTGRRFLFKVGQYGSGWGNNTPAEWVSFLLAKHLGAAIPETKKAVMPFAPGRYSKPRNRRGLLYEYIEDVQQVGRGWADFKINVFKKGIAQELVRQMVLDYLLADSDRHAGNFIHHKGKRIWGIDHGFAFRAGPSVSPTDRYTRAGGGVYYGVLNSSESSKFLKCVKPQDFIDVLDRVDSMTDAEYRRMLGKFADKDTMDRKRWARRGFSEMMTSVISNTDGIVPKVWVEWFNKGGAF